MSPKTTSMMDVFTEYNLLGDYCRWTDSSARFARKEGGQEAMEVANFWAEMNEELLIDFEEVRRERERLKVHEYRHRDGRWEIVDFERARGAGDVPWRDPVRTPGRDERSGGVTHSTTDLPIWCLSMAERTGCPVLTSLWSYVLGKQHLCPRIGELTARTPPNQRVKWQNGSFKCDRANPEDDKIDRKSKNIQQ